ncbi:hypothetical protein [Mucilaginibacter sp. SP1R1]|uniref:hypothetical protein n=1 Tax=Mucilaginibacter sp. SP1R1 TaxID=2723091 RepID=UPI00160837F4|nr:hypothetical protein [Mucilaginibacter sp. SP1R1]MBB6148324.1 tetratricopeptide (TPR) repeat protein [Mucilaginibacter sp. SP1R1]
MKKLTLFFAILWLGFIITAGIPCYAQYNEKQIDSIFAVAGLNDLKPDAKETAIAYMAYNVSKRINYAKGVAEGLTLYARNSYNAGQYDTAFKYITQAENVSASVIDPILILNIRIFKGLCYSRLGFYKEADENLTRVIPIVERISSEEDRHYYLSIIYTDLTLNYDRMGNKNAKEFWGNKSYAEAEQLQKSNRYMWVAAIAASNRANRFTTLGEYDSAGLYLNKSLFLVDQCTNAYRYRKYYALWVVNIHAGNFYDAKKEFSKSAFYYRNALNAAGQIKYIYGLKGAYTGLAKAYTSLNRPREALKYFERSNQLNDSIAHAEKAALKTPLEYIIHTKEQVLNKDRQRYHQIIFTAFLLLFIIIIAVCFYRYQLNKEIRLKTEEVAELVKKIALNEDKNTPAKIEELKTLVQLAVNNNPAFLMKFNEFDPEFASKLLKINPTLVAVEIEFCALLRLNFETKEIARYTGLSVRSVEGKKYRVRKKLNIPSDQDVNIWVNRL